MYKNSDELLYVISERRQLNWLSFKQVFQRLLLRDRKSELLESSSLKKKRSQTVRTLASLGHCDFKFSHEGNEVYAAPPILTRLPSAGFPQAILSGARSPDTIQELSDACQSLGQHCELNIAEQPERVDFAPTRISIQNEDIKDLEALSQFLKIPFLETPSAWSILHFSGSIDEYSKTLQWSDEDELKWQRQTFEPHSLQFREFPDSNLTIRLSQYADPQINIKRYYLWKEGRCAQVDRDWGRYWVLKAIHLNVLIYDRNQFIMAVPVGARLPQLLERALTLCSGYIATYRKSVSSSPLWDGGFNLFQAIPPQIAELTATKLGQTLSLRPIRD